MFEEAGLLFLLFISLAVSAPEPQDSLEDIVEAIGDCVPGFELKEGQGCVEIKEESIDDLFDCESGLELKEGVGCVPIECPPGTEFLVQTNGCTEKCSASEEYNKDTDQCVPKCSSDLEYNSERMTCVPKDVCTDPLEIGKLVSNSQEDGFDLRIGDNCEKRSCAAYADQGFVCVPFHICRNRTIVTDGSKLLDIRVDDDEDISSNDDESCCVNRSGIIDVSDSKCRRGEVCCLNPDYRVNVCDRTSKCPGQEPTLKSEDLAQCGRIPKQFSVKVENSRDKGSEKYLAQPGEFPHMCIVYRKANGINTYVGGASLIARNKVLTVAHKFLVKTSKVDEDIVFSPDIYVRCGEHDVKLTTEFLQSQESRVLSVHLHPDYDKKNIFNNLAILETESNFIYQKHIGPVCLPSPGERFEGLTDCISTGWGADAQQSTNPNAVYSDVLKKVTLPVMRSRDQCAVDISAIPRYAEKNIKFKLHSSWICVGGEKNEDTCEGDGGSPHVCRINDRWVQVGAVAFGWGCGDGVPAIYSSVSNGMCWIDWIMSCKPLASENIDFTPEPDLRTESLKSANGLTASECGSWLNDHPDLKRQCNLYA